MSSGREVTAGCRPHRVALAGSPANLEGRHTQSSKAAAACAFIVIASGACTQKFGNKVVEARVEKSSGTKINTATKKMERLVEPRSMRKQKNGKSSGAEIGKSSGTKNNAETKKIGKSSGTKIEKCIGTKINAETKKNGKCSGTKKWNQDLEPRSGTKIWSQNQCRNDSGPISNTLNNGQLERCARHLFYCCSHTLNVVQGT